MVRGETGLKTLVKEGSTPRSPPLGAGLLRRIRGFKTVRLKKIAGMINREEAIDGLILITYAFILLGVLVSYGR